VLNKISDFPKTNYKIFRLLASGLASYGGEKWSKHRRLINPAFHLEQLKVSFIKQDIGTYSILCYEVQL